MKKYVLSISLLCLSFLSFPGFTEDAAEEEEFLTGQELLDGCKEDASPGVPSQYCMHYIFGFVQNIEMLHASEPEQPRLFCIDPQVVGLPEVTKKTENWLESKPGRLHQKAYLLVGEALATNYPCGQTPF